MRASGRGLVWIVLGLAVLAAVIVLVIRSLRHEPPVVVTSAPPATVPATLPSTKPTRSRIAKAPEPKPFTYFDAIKATYPALPATQPLAVPLSLPQAAHLLIHDAVYIDPRFELWITRLEAPPMEKVLANPDPDGENIVPERVLFIHWTSDPEQGLVPWAIVPSKSASKYPGLSARVEFVTPTMRKPIGSGRDYQWGRSRSWGDRIVVPSSTGISVFHFERDPGGLGRVPLEDYQDLLDPGAPDAVTHSLPATTLPVRSTVVRSTTTESDRPEPQLLWDGQGFLAWLPWERGKPGGIGAARYVDEKWSALGPHEEWPQKILHLIPLLGGGIMQLFIADDGKSTRLGISEISSGGEIDRKALERIVFDLADGDPKVREDAFAKLGRYGPSVRPLLREMAGDLPPEAQARVNQLLREQVQPLLGPMTLLGPRIDLVSRHADGGAVFYLPAGVSIAQPDAEPTDQVPAWLAVRPGKAVQVLPGSMVGELNPAKAQVIAVSGHDDDWLVVADVRGPRRFYGNGLNTMLRKNEEKFSQLVGVDRRGRWFFREPGRLDPSGPVPETLILDPTLPDITPRLPVWNFTAADEVGWDDENWPVVRSGEALMRLRETDWVTLPKEKSLLTLPEQVSATKPTSRPTETPLAGDSTRPATMTSDPVADAPLLVTADGTRYFGGEEDLRVVSPDGVRTTWSLPAIATGKPPVHLIQTEDGQLFLFNQPGRVLRIKPTPGAAEPFKHDATFTRNVPNVDVYTRVWLDPAGRIIIAYPSRLAILFPSGYVPAAIRDKILDIDEVEGIDALK